jgi:hypothetical protein
MEISGGLKEEYITGFTNEASKSGVRFLRSLSANNCNYTVLFAQVTYEKCFERLHLAAYRSIMSVT